MLRILLSLSILLGVVNSSSSQGENADLIDSLLSKELIKPSTIKYYYSDTYKEMDHDLYFILKLLFQNYRLFKRPLHELQQIFHDLRFNNKIFQEVLYSIYKDNELDDRTKYHMLICATVANQLKNASTKEHLPKNLKNMGYQGENFDKKIMAFQNGKIDITELLISSQIFHKIPNQKISIQDDLIEVIQELINTLFEEDNIQVEISKKADNVIFYSSGYNYFINKNEILNVYSEDVNNKKDSINLNELNYTPILDLAQQLAADNKKYAAIQLYDFYDLFSYIHLENSYDEFAVRFPQYDFIKNRYAILKLNDRDYNMHSLIALSHETVEEIAGNPCHTLISNPKSTDINYMSTLVTSAEKTKFYDFLKNNQHNLQYTNNEIEDINTEMLNSRIYDKSNLFSYLNIKKLRINLQIHPTKIPKEGASLKNQFYSIYNFFDGQIEVENMQYDTASNLVVFEYNNEFYKVRSYQTDVFKQICNIICQNKDEKRLLYTINEFGRIRYKEYYFLEKELKDNLEDLLSIRFSPVDF